MMESSIWSHYEEMCVFFEQCSRTPTSLIMIEDMTEGGFSHIFTADKNVAQESRYTLQLNMS